MKSFTDIEQSKKLAEILPTDSADMLHCIDYGDLLSTVPKQYSGSFRHQPELTIPCWSLSALFDVVKDKCGYFELVYLKQTSDSKANPFRLSTDVYDVYDKEVVDACVEIIIKLYKKGGDE